MHRSCRTLWFPQAGLAALLTLLSGAPQLTCVCPDGRVYPFCPGLPTPCCCGDAGPAAPGVKPCGQVKRQGAAGRTRPQLESPGCRKTLTPSAVAAAPTRPADVRPAPQPHAPAFDLAAASAAGPAPRSFDSPDPPRHSPDDLTVSLRRLLI